MGEAGGGEGARRVLERRREGARLEKTGGRQGLATGSTHWYQRGRQLGCPPHSALAMGLEKGAHALLVQQRVDQVEVAAWWRRRGSHAW